MRREEVMLDILSLQNVVLSDSIKDGSTTYNYWNLLFTKLSLNPPVIDLSRGDNKDDSLTVSRTSLVTDILRQLVY